MSNNSNRKDYAKLIHLNIYITRGFKYDDKAYYAYLLIMERYKNVAVKY